MSTIKPEHHALASRNASLGVGHIWTETTCPAYRTLDPADCTCAQHPPDCLYCQAGEGMRHNYEAPGR